MFDYLKSIGKCILCMLPGVILLSILLNIDCNLRLMVGAIAIFIGGELYYQWNFKI